MLECYLIIFKIVLMFKIKLFVKLYTLILYSLITKFIIIFRELCEHFNYTIIKNKLSQFTLIVMQ